MIKEVTWPVMMVALVSVVCLVRIYSVAQELRRVTKGDARKLTAAMFGTCAEIALATFAAFVDHLLLWAIIKAVGRLIEYIFWQRFYTGLRPKGASSE